MQRKLSEIADIINGYAFKSKNYVEEGIRIIRIANVQDGIIVDEQPCYYMKNTIENFDKYELFAGDLLISLTGNVGRVGILEKEMLPAALNQRVGCIRLKTDTVDLKYLFYYFRRKQFQMDCIKASKGVAQLNLSTRWLENYLVLIPPMGKQKHIVERIEELFSELDMAVENLKTVKQQLEVYRQTVYHSIYDGITDMYPITDFFDITGGLTKNSKRNELSIKMPYLRVANVYYNHLDLSDIKKIGVKENEIEKCVLKENDLLFVEGNGSKDQIGRVAIWDGRIPNCLHQNHLIKGRPKGNMLSKFALFYLISRGGRKQINEMAKSTSGLYTLSTNKVKNLRIPYCSLPQQYKLLDWISDCLSTCDYIERTVDAALSQAEAMRQSILKEAFEGRLV